MREMKEDRYLVFDKTKKIKIKVLLFLFAFFFFLIFQKGSLQISNLVTNKRPHILSFSSSNKNVTVLILSYFPLESTSY